jgi:putative ABC transport system substrate-binding protein
VEADMKLRAFRITLTIALSILLLPLTASAEPPAKVHRLGMLSAAASSATVRALPNYKALFEELGALGYVEGRNLIVEIRSAEGKLDRLPGVAADLVAAKPDVLLVGTCGAPLDALRRATSTIPIVVAACTNDMVAAGIVASLARPGGNVTGLQKLTPELSAKRLELLKQVLPGASRVAVMWDPGYSDFAADWRALRTAARTLNVTLLLVEARGPGEFEAAFVAMAAEGAEAFVTFSDAITYVHAQQLADVAARQRLPAVYSYAEISNAGGLMSYGPSIPELFRRAGTFVDKIFKGAKPSDLPVEQPTRFDLVVNLKTAKTLGITIPQFILIRADRVIE